MFYRKKFQTVSPKNRFNCRIFVVLLTLVIKTSSGDFCTGGDGKLYHFGTPAPSCILNNDIFVQYEFFSLIQSVPFNLFLPTFTFRVQKNLKFNSGLKEFFSAKNHFQENLSQIFIFLSPCATCVIYFTFSLQLHKLYLVNTFQLLDTFLVSSKYKVPYGLTPSLCNI